LLVGSAPPAAADTLKGDAGAALAAPPPTAGRGWNGIGVALGEASPPPAGSEPGSFEYAGVVDTDIAAAAEKGLLALGAGVNVGADDAWTRGAIDCATCITVGGGGAAERATCITVGVGVDVGSRGMIGRSPIEAIAIPGRYHENV
jgi:hypothetical protein